MPHIHELYDYTVAAFIVSPDGNHVLLVNHPRYSKWIPVGGHIELDEDPEDALYREIQEEAGLEVEPVAGKPDVESPGTKFLPAPHYLDVHEANPPHKHISFTYFVRAKSEDFTLSSEHDEMKWFTAEELDDKKYNLSAEVKFLVTEALKFFSIV